VDMKRLCPMRGSKSRLLHSLYLVRAHYKSRGNWDRTRSLSLSWILDCKTGLNCL
jgi:hypothetical protein